VRLLKPSKSSCHDASNSHHPPSLRKIYIAGNVLCLMPVGKDQTEQIVAENLKRKYLNIEGIVFTSFEQYVYPVLHKESGTSKIEVRNSLVLSGMFKVKNVYGIFTYIIDAETGEIMEYKIIPPIQ